MSSFLLPESELKKLEQFKKGNIQPKKEKAKPPAAQKSQASQPAIDPTQDKFADQVQEANMMVAESIRPIMLDSPVTLCRANVWVDKLNPLSISVLSKYEIQAWRYIDSFLLLAPVLIGDKSLFDDVTKIVAQVQSDYEYYKQGKYMGIKETSYKNVPCRILIPSEVLTKYPRKLLVNWPE